jgi:hypothetical protein
MRQQGVLRGAILGREGLRESMFAVKKWRIDSCDVPSSLTSILNPKAQDFLA